jgi:arylsulfatase A-like enzyme
MVTIPAAIEIDTSSFRPSRVRPRRPGCFRKASSMDSFRAMPRFVFVVAAWLATCLAAGGADPAPAAAPPNIVIMLIDDMGLMDTSVPMLTDADGRPRRYPLNDFYRTPAMERLAARGIRFSNFYAMSVCSPTRISLMTGQNAARHRTTNWIDFLENNGGPHAPDWNWRGLHPDHVTLPAILRGHGYRTIHVGKGHFAPQDEPGADPSTLGFDVNVGGTFIGAPGSYYGTDHFRGVRNRRGERAVPGLEKYHGQEIYLSEALTVEARDQVEKAVADGVPFFLYFAHYAVHSPFHADPRFTAHYADSGQSPQAQAFATMIEGIDASLGGMLDQLDSLGVAGNTLVVFLGDNGTDAPLGHEHDVACAAPLRGKKGAHYEGGMRVPFLAAWAAEDRANPWQERLPIAAGAVQTQVAAVQDIFPTILGLEGLPIPAGHVIDGRPLDTLLAGRPDPSRDETFLMHYPHAPHRSDYFTVWRDGDWKVVYHYLPTAVSGDSHYQLFNLRDDPAEQHDLAGERPDELRRMMQGLVDACRWHVALYPLDPVTREPLEPVLP